jgi:acyl-coenzyme A synthetase/AMP-(fatty) acid ligase
VSPKNVDVNDAKNAVALKLPYYCTPAMVVAIDELPLTNNGKIDKRALTILAVKMQEQEVTQLEEVVTFQMHQNIGSSVLL